MSKILNDADLEAPEAVPASKGEALNSPINGDTPPPVLEAWALPGGVGKGHPRARVGYLPKGTAPTLENLRKFFPDSLAEVGERLPHGTPSGLGFDVGGKSPAMAWKEFLRGLSNRQIAIDSAKSGTLMVTSGALSGHGKLPVLTCGACQTSNVVLGNDGRCASGCPR